MQLQRKTGFTLVELLVVIAIIGILIALLLVLTRIRSLPFGNWIKSIMTIQYSDMFGTSIGNTFNILYIPGVIPFILVVIALAGIRKSRPPKGIGVPYEKEVA